jgi:hypothetical protein
MHPQAREPAVEEYNALEQYKLILKITQHSDSLVERGLRGEQRYTDSLIASLKTPAVTGGKWRVVEPINTAGRSEASRASRRTAAWKRELAVTGVLQLRKAALALTISGSHHMDISFPRVSTLRFFKAANPPPWERKNPVCL